MEGEGEVLRKKHGGMVNTGVDGTWIVFLLLFSCSFYSKNLDGLLRLSGVWDVFKVWLVISVLKKRQRLTCEIAKLASLFRCLFLCRIA